MNSVVEQRLLIDHERQCIIQSPGLTALGGCERHPQQAEDSVFMTPKSSPAYSTDGNAYPSDNMGYFASAQPSPTSMGKCIEPPAPHPLVSTSSGFMGPASPCDEFGSPYSPPYDNPSPHSIACSASPHGSPASIACSDGQYSPYLSPSPSIHDIPASTLPMSSDMSIPYSVDSGSLIYTSVPTTAAGYYSSMMTQTHWMNGNEMPSFDPFQQGEHPQLTYDGEIPVAVIDMQIPRDGAHIEAEMNTQLNFYSSPCSSPDRQNTVYYDMPQMVHPELTPSAVCPPFTPKPSKSTQKPKRPPKPVVQVNDEHIKDIPTSAQLWEFTLRVLKKPAYNYMINWENRKEGLFRFHDAPAFAALWGKHRNRPNMTYDKVARALRYYYKRDILNQVGGRLTYRFSKRLGKLYATDD